MERKTMFPSSFSFGFIMKTVMFAVLLNSSLTSAQLNPWFYAQTCNNVTDIVRGVLAQALVSDPRIAASLIRLHFHDCFVQGCDASLLLDNSSSIVSEKDAVPNRNSARGFEVVDAMKIAVEKVCPNTVSCADILTIAAEESVHLSGGPFWASPLGRRDGVTASRSIAENLPSPFEKLNALKAKFANVGLNRSVDLVALSGGHTFGKAKCLFVLSRLYNFNGTGLPDPSMNASYLTQLKQLCPQAGNSTFLVDLDITTPNAFDNAYFTNLKLGKGYLQSDQDLFSVPGSDTIAIVNLFSTNTAAFFQAFVDSMIRMGNISPLTGTQGQIRKNCRVVNGNLLGDNDLVSSI